MYSCPFISVQIAYDSLLFHGHRGARTLAKIKIESLICLRICFFRISLRDQPEGQTMEVLLLIPQATNSYHVGDSGRS